jgi:hypothetical protein
VDVSVEEMLLLKLLSQYFTRKEERAREREKIHFHLSVSIMRRIGVFAF